jgi:hypothetical protein
MLGIPGYNAKPFGKDFESLIRTVFSMECESCMGLTMREVLSVSASMWVLGRHFRLNLLRLALTGEEV